MEGAPDWPADRLWTLFERRARDDPRLLADAHPRAHAARRARRPTSRRCARSSRPASRGTRRRTAGSSSRSAAAAARSSTARAAPRSARASSRRLPPSRSRSARSAGPRSAWRWTSSTREGNSVRGEVGELVCRKPFPGMTRGFWRDPERYLETYWSRLPGVWVHGDWASVDEDGYWFLHGRSDDTLNIAGKRIGPGRARVGRGRAPRGCRGGGGRHPARGEGRGRVGLLRPGAGDRADATSWPPRCAAPSPPSSARRSRPTASSSCPRSPRRAARRSCAAPSAPRRSGEDPGDLSSVENPESLEAIADAI